MQFAYTCLMNDCDYDGLFRHLIKLNYCDCMFIGMLCLCIVERLLEFIGAQKYQDTFNPIYA